MSHRTCTVQLRPCSVLFLTSRTELRKQGHRTTLLLNGALTKISRLNVRVQNEDERAMSEVAKIGVVTVSDRASRGEYEDRGGPAIREYLGEVLRSAWTDHPVIVSDEQADIEAAIIRLADDEGCCLIVTTGGTGPALRDVTPEATEAVCQKMMPGFGELMRQESLKYVPTAILSRQTAGIRGGALVVNLPGQPKAIAECLDAVFPAIPYCVDLIGGPYMTTNEDRLKAFRPKSARRPPASE